MVKRIEHNNELLAIIIPANHAKPGIEFFTPDDFSQQLAFMQHPAGKTIPPHVHNLGRREVHFTQEALFVRRGKLRVDFYDNDQRYLESRVLEAGDVILLATGGHGLEVLEPVEIIEVKQGPYVGEQDKSRFPQVAADKIIIKETK
jgi:mannose-6-phosphate isomerase-like protein (cupin superfamily)